MNPKQPELELLRELPATAGRRVWEAVQKPLGRKIAYVRLAEGVLPSSPRARALLDEARACARLDHPSVAVIYSISVTPTDVLVEEELAQGESIVSYVAAHAEAMVPVLAQVASALAHAHERGVLHGGLDAHAVQVLESGAAKVRGFRFIVPDSRSIVSADAAFGASLLCPEVQKGGLYSALSDIFLFGALAYHVITGEPLSGESRSLGSSTSGLSGIETAARRGLSELVNRCLAPIPADRPETMREVCRELEGMLAAGRSRGRELPSRARVPTLWILAAIGLVSVLALSVWVFRSRPHEQTRLSRVPLESSENQKARLRVVARPWARVFVDGEYQDTTPFAALLTVSPGQHWIRLEHPNAPPEERLVEVQGGQIGIVDVEMKIQRSPLPRGEAIPFVETTP